MNDEGAVRCVAGSLLSYRPYIAGRDGRHVTEGDGTAGARNDRPAGAVPMLDQRMRNAGFI